MRIENDFVCIELDEDSGGFRRLYDKSSNHEYVRAPERAMLLRLMTPEGDAACRHVDGAGASIETSAEGVVMVYNLDGIEAQVSLSLDGAALNAHLRMANRSNRVVEEVMFPCVSGLGPMPDGRLVWPNFWTREIVDPLGKGLGGDHRTWNEGGQKLVTRYPGHMASAWCDYGNTEHGLALEARHTDFSPVDFALHKVLDKTRTPIERSLDIATVCPRRVRPGEIADLPPFRLVLHEGDWHAAAKDHRDWLDTWIAKPDRPARCAEAIGWHFFFMKHQDGLEVHDYADLPCMAEAARAAGCPYLLVFGWQDCGHDNNYCYRYVPNKDWGGEAALKEAIAACRAIGVEVIPFFNGTLANIMMPEHQEFGHCWEAKTRAGHPYYAGDWARHNVDIPTRNRAMLHHELCFCTQQRSYFLDTARRIVQQYGFGNTQLDQISEKVFCCYNETHAHDRPDYAPIEGLAELLPETRRIVREANPEGIMVSECLNEFTGQWCDSSWDWTILLPFPEPILYTLPWLLTSHEIDALEFGEVNKAFAYKMHLDLKIDGGDAPVTKYPAFADHIRRNAELRRRLGEYFCTAAFRDQERLEVQGGEGVLVKVYINDAARKAAIVAAETEGAPATVTLRSSLLAGALVRIESNQREPGETEAGSETVLDLKPYEIRVLCVDLA
ncbi:MAG TPA: hypothetical protein ENN42_08035 [Thioalkalivibrio sp.]|nr:hypothetical protein [Thioalkalivibrio sp.]